MGKNTLFKLMPWLVLCLFVFAYAKQIPLVSDMRLFAFDNYQKIFPRQDNKDIPVYVIDIDEKSLKEIGQWPWPRNILARLIDNAFELGVKSMGLDMVFPESDGKSPEVVSKYWQENKEIKPVLNKLPSHDNIFANSLSKHLVVKGIVASFDNNSNGSSLKSSINIVNKQKILKYIKPAKIMVKNIDILSNSSPYVGNFSYLSESDSVVRKLSLLIKDGDNIFPALSIETLKLYSGAKSYEAVYNDKGLKFIKIEPFDFIPVSKDGDFRVYYRKFNKNHYISAVDVLRKNKKAKALDGSVAILGTSATGLFDLRSTPVDAVVPGVETHAQAIENIMLGNYINRPDNAYEIELYSLIILGAFMIIIIQYLGALGAVVLFTFSILSLIGVCFYQFKMNGLLYDWYYPTFALFIIFLIQSLSKYAEEKNSRLVIKNAFAHYLSPDLVKIVSKDPSKLSLGGEQKEISVLFSDIRGFTSISEGLSPKQLTNVLNRYLTPMTDIVQNNKGTIDKYMGDAVMAFWNAPLDIKNHAYMACKTALEMLSELDKLNVSLIKDNLPEIKIGIGINTGVMNVGNMGSKQRFDYTVMGDNVNLGARLEGQCKTYDVPLIISEKTLKHLKNVSVMTLDKIAVKGKTEGVWIYHLIGLDKPTPELAQKIELVKKAIDAYQAQEWKKAKELFKNKLMPLTLRIMYLERIAKLEIETPDNWDGVYRAISK